MAAQEVEKAEARGTVGIERGINAGAVGMVMGIVQEQQYQKPTESTVRELTANAVDSQSEKDRAFEIIRDGVSPDKYFVKREGALYSDSHWSPDYYNLASLNEKENNVELTYKRGEGGGRCDTFIVKDHGVGIGGTRLEGVLEIGYSTKRNRKDALGAFGIGAKVGLATGADYYTITSVYNGIKHIIKVFARKSNSLVGALNLDTGKPNIAHTFSTGEVIYGEATDELNYTTIAVPVMKHRRGDYIRAVETQLLYFHNVKFFLEDEDGDSYEHNFKADLLHNSPNLVISSNSPYSKPHIVIVKGGEGADTSTGVCYGHVDFAEMELQDMSGDIGIKCPIRQVITDEDGTETVISEGVDVIASREAVRWSTNTREFLKKQFAVAQDEASHLIEKELAQTDFVKWLEACTNIAMISSRSNTAIGRLSKIVNISDMKPRFNKSKIQFDNVSGLFNGFKVVQNTKFLDKADGKYKVSRDTANGWNDVKLDAFYLKDINAQRHTDCYLADKHDGVFTTISPKSHGELTTEGMSLVEAGKMFDKNLAPWIKARQERCVLMTKWLEESSEHKVYDTVVVPDDYISNLSKIETKVVEDAKEVVIITAAERRKLQERVVCNTFVSRYMVHNEKEGQTYQRSKKEPMYQEILDFEGTLYYGFQADEEKLQFACHLLDKNNQGLTAHSDRFYNKEYRIVMIARTNKKHFASHKHIDDFFGTNELVHGEDGRIKGCNIIMDNAVVHWNTARKMAEYMEDLSFLTNFSTFDEKVQEDYDEIKAYVSRYKSDLTQYGERFGMKEHYGSFLEFIAKVEKIQAMSNGSHTAEEIGEEVKAMSLPNGITGGLVLNTDMIEKLDKMRTFADPIKTLLNAIPVMKKPGQELPLELSMIISEFIEWKGEKYEVGQEPVKEEV